MAYGYQRRTPQATSISIAATRNWGARLALIFAAAVALLALSLASVGQASAAGQAKGVAYIWDNVTLTDANGTGVYQIRGGVTTTKDGRVTTTETWCDYIEQPAPGASWQDWVIAGTYRVNYAVADTSEAGLKQYCTLHFADRTLQ
jgi:hypothetical protein